MFRISGPSDSNNKIKTYSKLLNNRAIHFVMLLRTDMHNIRFGEEIENNNNYYFIMKPQTCFQETEK